MATKKTIKKTVKKTALKKGVTEKRKVKKGSRYVCGVCGRVETMNLIETIDGVYGYVDAADLICCSREMQPRK